MIISCAPHALDKSMAQTIDSVTRIQPKAFGLIGAAASRRRTTESVIVRVSLN